MSLATSYAFLVLAVVLGVTSNSFAKSAEGFTLLLPSVITGITIVMCMYALSIVMKNIPMGITYASFAGLTIIATVVVGIIRFNQIPNLYSIIGLSLIIAGVLILIGGLAMVGSPAPEGVDRDPMSSIAMLFAPGIFQIALGAIKIKKSSN